MSDRTLLWDRDFIEGFRRPVKMVTATHVLDLGERQVLRLLERMRTDPLRKQTERTRLPRTRDRFLALSLCQQRGKA